MTIFILYASFLESFKTVKFASYLWFVISLGIIENYKFEILLRDILNLILKLKYKKPRGFIFSKKHVGIPPCNYDEWVAYKIENDQRTHLQSNKHLDKLVTGVLNGFHENLKMICMQITVTTAS